MHKKDTSVGALRSAFVSRYEHLDKYRTHNRFALHLHSIFDKLCIEAVPRGPLGRGAGRAMIGFSCFRIQGIQCLRLPGWSGSANRILNASKPQPISVDGQITLRERAAICPAPNGT